MGGAYKFTNDELRFLLYSLEYVPPQGDNMRYTLDDKIRVELARRDTVAKRQAGKGTVRKKDVPSYQLIQAALLVRAGEAPLRKVVAITGVPYGRVWQMAKRYKEEREQNQGKNDETGQPNKSGPK